MVVGLATFDPSRYNFEIGPELAFVAVTIVSLPFCLPPIILGWVGRKKGNVKFGLAGLLWSVAGLAILMVGAKDTRKIAPPSRRRSMPSPPSRSRRPENPEGSHLPLANPPRRSSRSGVVGSARWRSWSCPNAMPRPVALCARQPPHSRPRAPMECSANDARSSASQAAARGPDPSAPVSLRSPSRAVQTPP
jgi:hypothetical protein